MPPCASRVAWKIRAISERTEAMAGPKTTAAKPDPVGWLLLPKTEGNLRAETTKMNAPMRASSGLASGFFFAILESL